MDWYLSFTVSFGASCYEIVYHKPAWQIKGSKRIKPQAEEDSEVILSSPREKLQS